MLKKISIACLLVGIAGTSQADTLTELNRCAAISDSLERLVCYDELVKTVNNGVAPIRQSSAQRTENMPAISAQTIPSVADNFGKEQIKEKTNKDKELDSVNFTIKSLKKDPDGAWQITFNNEQKWKQTDSGSLKLKPGDTVQLKKGMLGAIYLKRLDANKRIRVRRIK